MREHPAGGQSFGAFVRQRRRARGLTQEALAELVWVDQTWVSQVERDIFTPAKAKVAALALALGLSRREIYAHMGEIETDEELPGGGRAGIRHKLVAELDAAPELLRELDEAGYKPEEVIAVIRAMARAGRRHQSADPITTPRPEHSWPGRPCLSRGDCGARRGLSPRQHC